MEQSRREIIMNLSSFFLAGEMEQIASFIDFPNRQLLRCVIAKAIFFEVFNNHICGLSGVSRSSRPCLIQMALQIGHAFSLFGAITASDVFQDLIANWMLEV